MDPEGNGATMNEGAEGGPGPPGRGKDKQSALNSEAARRSWNARRSGGRARCDIKTSLCTKYVLLYMFTYCKLDKCNRERCLICLSVSGE